MYKILDALDELLAKLISDGPSLRTRRSLGLSQVISKDLIPFLTSASTEHKKVVPKVIKVLSFLTSPIECLIPEEFVTTEEGQQVAYEVESLLYAVKVEFTEFKVTKAVVEYLKKVTSKVCVNGIFC
jgi:timeless protein